jgi:hypothetical protein
VQWGTCVPPPTFPKGGKQRRRHPHVPRLTNGLSKLLILLIYLVVFRAPSAPQKTFVDVRNDTETWTPMHSEVPLGLRLREIEGRGI